MEIFQMEELKNYELDTISNYKEYPIRIGDVLGVNEDSTVAILSDNSYMFRIKDTFLKLGFMKNNEVDIVTLSHLDFIEDSENPEDVYDLIGKSLALNKFKVVEAVSGPNSSCFRYSKETLNNMSIVVEVEYSRKELTVTMFLHNEKEVILELKLSKVTDLKQVYHFLYNVFGIDLNTGIKKDYYKFNDSVVERYLERIGEVQAELSDEEFLNVLEAHPEYVTIYQNGNYNRENTKKILETFVEAVERKRNKEYKTQYRLMEKEVLKMEKALIESKKQLEDFAKKYRVMKKTIDDLDL